MGMSEEELVLLARISLSLGTEDNSIALLAIQYRPCCLPGPNLIRRSVSRGSVVGSNSSPWRLRAASVYWASLG
jgi:hypothetical protein